MNPVTLGALCGLAFGIVAVLLMLPMQFPDKKTALTAAFLSRFAIGFLIPLCHVPVPWPVTGAFVGLIISLPDAVISKAYAPIVAVGIVGGTVIGWIASQALG